MVFDILALLCTALFFGACVYVSFVEQPARLTLLTSAALAQWRPSYKRAAAMQIALSLGGIICAVIAFGLKHQWPVLAGGLLLATVAPLTLIVIMPINKQLLDPSRTGDSPDTLVLLEKWGRLHFYRTMISFLALVILTIHIITIAR